MTMKKLLVIAGIVCLISFYGVTNVRAEDDVDDDADVDEEDDDVPTESTESMYDDEPAVEEIEWDDWIETVVEEEEMPYLVNFYAPWCSHCRKIKDFWVGFGQSLSQVVKVAAVNVANPVNKNLQTLYAAKGIPAIYFFPAGARRKPIRYPYGDDMDLLVDFTLGNMPLLTASVNDGNFDDFVAKAPETPKFLLFTTNGVPPNVYNALAFQFRQQAVFAQANRDDSAGLIERFKVKKYPQLVTLPKVAGKKAKLYKGSLDYGDLLNFLSDKVAKRAEGSMEDFYEGYHIPKDFELMPSMDPKDFNDTIVKADGPSLLFLYHPWYYPAKYWIRSLESIYASKQFEGKLNMVWANADEEEGIDIFVRLKAKNIPVLWFFPGNNRKGKGFSGEHSKDNLVKFIEDGLKGMKKGKKGKSDEL